MLRSRQAIETLTAMPSCMCSKEVAHQGDEKYIGHSEFKRLVSSTRTLEGAHRQLATRAALAISAAAGMRVSDTLHIKLHEMHVSPECDTGAGVHAPLVWQAETPLLVFGNTQGKGTAGGTGVAGTGMHCTKYCRHALLTASSACCCCCCCCCQRQIKLPHLCSMAPTQNQLHSGAAPCCTCAA
jgi:hypothetical protein